MAERVLGRAEGVAGTRARRDGRREAEAADMMIGLLLALAMYLTRS